jgi:hypothetical protein
MDYGKSGAAKGGRNAPKHVEKSAPGGEQNPYGKPVAKAELLARMKAAAVARAEAGKEK